MSNKRGPKFKDFNWATFDNLCGIQCTKREIADVLEVSESTIERAVKRKFNMNYDDYYQQKASKGRISLRRKQYEVAQSGNVTMLIWLGKQYLGQADKNESTVKMPVMNLSDDEINERLLELTEKNESI